MFFAREQIEQRERQTLAPYALMSGDSHGRKYPEPEDSIRTAFQRDRDRVLHTTAFRRLEYKTQVFVNHEGDYFRTRLTHTLEVAQIGRTIARALGANEDLVETICLAHDLGHPPFGHSGEEVLNDLMRKAGGFEHNQQSLRILTLLEKRYPQFDGLNLTYEVREGVVKHETRYDPGVDDPRGEYAPGRRASLEAQIANIADETAYTAHDLDDGLYAGLITPRQLNGKIALWDMGREALGFDGAEFNELMRHRLTSWLVGMLVTDICETTRYRIVTNQPGTPEAVQQLSNNLIGHSDTIHSMIHDLRDFLYANVYRHYRVVRMAEKASRFLRELFGAYLSQPAQLPPGAQMRQQAEEAGLERVICDYIAGMTDRYALQEYEKLFDPFSRP